MKDLRQSTSAIRVRPLLDPCYALFSFTFGELGEPSERKHARVLRPIKGAGKLRRAVRSQAFARILGGRHMECASYFILGGRHMECAYYFDFCRPCLEYKQNFLPCSHPLENQNPS